MAVGAGSILVNLTFQVGALITATDRAYDAATTLLLLDLHAYGYALGGVFFGLWLLPMGWVARPDDAVPDVARRAPDRRLDRLGGSTR